MVKVSVIIFLTSAVSDHLPILVHIVTSNKCVKAATRQPSSGSNKRATSGRGRTKAVLSDAKDNSEDENFQLSSSEQSLLSNPGHESNLEEGKEDEGEGEGEGVDNTKRAGIQFLKEVSGGLTSLMYTDHPPLETCDLGR